MRKQTTLFYLALIICTFALNSKAQTKIPVSQMLTGSSNENGIIHAGQKKGSFFIIPFYEVTSFKKLKMISHTNNYKLWQGESSYTFTKDEIAEYNNNFDTEYQNSMTGIKFGYQLMDGMGVSTYVGVNYLDAKTWVADENEHAISSSYPALTLGLAVDYQKAITDKLAAMAMLSYNYCSTGSVAVDNTSGEDVNSSSMKTMYYEMNLVLAYHYKRLLPYVGAGFTQQFMNTLHEEEIPTTNDLEEDVFNYTEFDSQFRGSSIYGFAGLEYSLIKNVSIYARSSFVNPLRVNVGFKIAL